MAKKGLPAAFGAPAVALNGSNKDVAIVVNSNSFLDIANFG